MIASVTMAQLGIGTTKPDASSVLDLTSTNKGLLPPRVTTVYNISSPAAGLMVFDEFNSCIRFYSGTDWSDCIDGSLTGCAVKINATDYANFLCHNLGADYSLDPHTPDVGLHGAYIQWGKKGPADWVTSDNVGTDGFAKAPTILDANAAVINDWATTTAEDGSWNSGTEESPEKVTLKDPCPDGFRVPTNAEWVAVDTYNTEKSKTGSWNNDSNYGTARHWGDATTPEKLTLPAAGYRHNTDGELNSRGNFGYYWSSTENGSYAYGLLFLSSGVNPANYSSRTYGYSVRCIAE